MERLKKLYNLFEDDLRPVLARIPLVGSLFRDGLCTSEGALPAVLVSLIAREALKEAPDWRVMGCLALALIGAGVYAYSRTRFKAAAMELEASEKTEPEAIEGFLGIK